MTFVLAVAAKNTRNAALWYNIISVRQWGKFMSQELINVNCCGLDIKSRTLSEIKCVCEQCRACELYKTRTHLVFSDGSPNADIMLIGEAPGADEDATGTPFVGRSGKLLNEFFENAGIDRAKQIYIANTIKCRPPQNRVPSHEEKLACRTYLNAQISIVKPKVLLMCGATSAQSFIEDDFKISQIRGKWLNLFDNMDAMVIFHPSYLLRNHSTEQGSPRWFMMRDLEAVKKRLETK